METTQSPSLGAAAQKIKEGATELKCAVMDQGSEKFEAICKSTDTLIRENPYRSVLLAFGIGALAGIFLFKR